MASTARRIAGNVGLGGPWRILFSPARLGEAAALQVGVGDHRHERVAVQAMPGSAFEWSRPSSSLSCWWACSQTHRALIAAGSGVGVGAGGGGGGKEFLLFRAGAPCA